MPELRSGLLGPGLSLVGFDQGPDALRVGFAVTVAGDGIGAAGGFDHDLSPEDAGGDVDGGDFRDGNALFVAAEHPRFHAADALRADDQAGGEKEIAMRPAAGGKGFGGGGVHRIVGRCGHNLKQRRRLGVCRQGVWPMHAVLDPFEGPFLPDPDVADDKDRQEDQHF